MYTYLDIWNCRRLPQPLISSCDCENVNDDVSVSPIRRMTSPVARPVEAILPGDTCTTETRTTYKEVYMDNNNAHI